MSAKAKGIVKQCLNASKKESEIPITATIPVHKCEPFRTFQNAASVRIPGILLLRVFQGQQYSCLEYRSTETAGHPNQRFWSVWRCLFRRMIVEMELADSKDVQPYGEDPGADNNRAC